MTHTGDVIISTTSGLGHRTSGFDNFRPQDFFTDYDGVLGFLIALTVLE